MIRVQYSVNVLKSHEYTRSAANLTDSLTQTHTHTYATHVHSTVQHRLISSILYIFVVHLNLR